MLKEMSIENFALIDKINLEFKKGFTVISGETGSGKSILIDAICFILGFKFSRDIIRNGEDKTSVEAIFDIEHDKINRILDENGISKDDYLLIRREGYRNGKSSVRINGKTVTNNILKMISRYLMDIHTQHQNYELLNNSNHISYLDRYIGTNICFDRYMSIYHEWYCVKSKIQEIQNNILDESHLDYVKFQIDELSNANLHEGEDDELDLKIRILNNSEKINNTLNFAMDNLKYSEQSSVNTILMNVIRSFRNIDSTLESLKDITGKLEGIYYDLESIFDDIKSIGNNVDFDLNEFDSINSRIYLINSLKRKFNKSTVKELLDYASELQSNLDEVLNQESILESLRVKEDVLYKDLSSETDNITGIRKRYAQQIENEIISELNYMGMSNVIFKINISKSSEFSKIGNDSVEFLISTNKGEPLKNLSKIVSGGELSRIMLALKIVFIGNEPISGIIFDEIDTGVSGKIARKVGEKMYCLSSKCQVFCITHLPQIASLSDNHYIVTKKVKDDKTYSDVKIINYEEKINEIAKMIGGDKITESVFINAKELIGNKKM